MDLLLGALELAAQSFPLLVAVLNYGLGGRELSARIYSYLSLKETIQ